MNYALANQTSRKIFLIRCHKPRISLIIKEASKANSKTSIDRFAVEEIN